MNHTGPRRLTSLVIEGHCIWRDPGKSMESENVGNGQKSYCLPWQQLYFVMDLLQRHWKNFDKGVIWLLHFKGQLDYMWSLENQGGNKVISEEATDPFQSFKD